MSDLDRWLDANDRFLGTAIAWLRDRLDRLAASHNTALVPVRPDPRPPDPLLAAPVPRPPAPSRSRLTRFWSTHDGIVDALPAEASAGSVSSGDASPGPGASSGTTSGSSAAAAASTVTSSASVSGSDSPLRAIDPASPEPPPALVLLARRLGLTEFESHILLLCAAMELDTRTGALCARAMQDPARPFPTFALALTLFDRPAWSALSPEGPLRMWRMLEIHQPNNQPLVSSALKADERIVNYLKGLNYLDDRLAPLVTQVPRDTAPLPASQQRTSDALAAAIVHARDAAQPPVLQLLGTDGESKLLVAERAAARLGLLLHRVTADALPSNSQDLETFARLWQREGALLPLGLYIDAADVDRTSGPAVSAVQRLCKRGMGVIFLDTRQQWPDLGRGALAFDVAKPTAAEQHATWVDLLGPSAGDADAAHALANRLAGQFNFNLPSIQALAASATQAMRSAARMESLGEAQGDEPAGATGSPDTRRGAAAVSQAATGRDVVDASSMGQTSIGGNSIGGSSIGSGSIGGGSTREGSIGGGSIGSGGLPGGMPQSSPSPWGEGPGGEGRSPRPATAATLSNLVWTDSLRHARPALDQLAQPLEPKAHWDDLELAPTEKGLLRQIAAQVGSRMAVYDAWGFRDRMNRGLGISVLFAGESGTGKTMAAEVLANDLSLMLYRIDLSSVVSKYIGETERNLRKLFDAAEDGGAILFFDEADALFGKRSEVKDSHDRYANIEINYLLQRMETYRGLAILATNMRSALDSAFCRRLRFIINFPFPGPAERLAIWKKAFPARAPLAGVDFARLARFNMTGGSIHNIALNAAFLAAHASEPITMRLVLEAVRNEYRKLEKPINEAEFKWTEPAAPGAATTSLSTPRASDAAMDGASQVGATGAAARGVRT